MSDKPSKFTVVDRRKFTLEGELRKEEQISPEEAEERAAAEKNKSEAPVSAPEQEEAPATASGPRLITMPSRKLDDEIDVDVEEELEEEEDMPPLPKAPSADETNEQRAAYEKSSADLDTMLREANPGMPESQEVNFEHLVQQLYLSAMMQMGAGTPEGERPRVDILGARQTIDLMSVLIEKTKGNLSEREERMLNNALFELRMNFMELTNMIAKSATQPPPGGLR